MCKLIAATPPTDEENVSIRINILGFILSDYDWGSFYLHPDRTDYSRTVIVSRKNKQFFADTIAALVARLKRSNAQSGLARSNLEMALRLERDIASLKTYE